MQEIREDLARRLERSVPLELFAEPELKVEPPQPANQPHPSGLNRKQRRALARERR